MVTIRDNLVLFIFFIIILEEKSSAYIVDFCWNSGRNNFMHFSEKRKKQKRKCVLTFIYEISLNCNVDAQFFIFIEKIKRRKNR